MSFHWLQDMHAGHATRDLLWAHRGAENSLFIIIRKGTIASLNPGLLWRRGFTVAQNQVKQMVSINLSHLCLTFSSPCLRTAIKFHPDFTLISSLLILVGFTTTLFIHSLVFIHDWAIIYNCTQHKIYFTHFLSDVDSVMWINDYESW